MLIDAPPTLLNTIIQKKHLSHFMAKTMNELAHKSPLIFYLAFPKWEVASHPVHPSLNPPLPHRFKKQGKKNREFEKCLGVELSCTLNI